MIFFIDSSALLKRYLQEGGSDQIDEVFEKASQIIVSPISLIECTSAASRLYREKFISRKQFQELKDLFQEEFRSFHVLDFSLKIEQSAIDLLIKHKLKTLDSLQLASAIFVKDKIEAFVCSDKHLLKTAHKEQFQVFNPQAVSSIA